MSIRRRFLGWDRPSLPAVVEALVESYSREGELHLGNVLVVFPGGRAARQFRELLEQPIINCVEFPDIVTVGALPEKLYQPQKPFANTITQQLAWAESLHLVPSDRVRIVTGELPDEQDVDGWLNLGRLFATQHTELARDCIHFGHVGHDVVSIGGREEQKRWEILREVQEAYLRTLDSLNLWDQQTARLVAIEKKECHSEQDIWLIGTVDLNRAHRQMLDLVAEVSDERVTAVIAAPEELAERFDNHGCLIPEQWEHAELDISQASTRLVDGPTDQANAVVEELAKLDQQYAADQIVIGLGQDSIVPYLRRRLKEEKIESRAAVELELGRTLPLRLLEAIAEYLHLPQTSQFTALVRHPDIFDWLQSQGIDTGWLDQLDNYISTHLPTRLQKWIGDDKKYHLAKDAFELVTDLLEELSGEPRPLLDWCEPIARLLVAVYGHREFRRDDPHDRIVLRSCEAVREVLDTFREIPELLMRGCSAAQALRTTVEMLERETIPPPPDPDAIEMLGWLELSLDDAPVHIVTSFNEGAIPESVSADLFLPNRLRQQLGLLDNARRYARDAYALCVLVNSRERLSLIIGRRDAQGNPLIPSRLLFAASEDDVVTQVNKFYNTEVADQPDLSSTSNIEEIEVPEGHEILSERQRIIIPRPLGKVTPPSRLSVTDFKRFINCPYLFYLSRVLKLEAINDVVQELQANQFGDLAHIVLEEFGISAIKHSDNAEKITEYLNDQLDTTANTLYGMTRLPAVSLQVEQLRERLKSFAELQASFVTDGWRIKLVEADTKGTAGATIELTDGRSMPISGRIDRIDQHAETGAWRIIDYKTSDSGKKPEQIHRKSTGRGEPKEWIDLQLPLYRTLAEPLGVCGEVEVGYIVLPSSSSGVTWQPGEWNTEELAEADDLSREVVRKILDGEFWDDNKPPDTCYEYSRICQEGAFDRDPTVWQQPPSLLDETEWEGSEQ